MKQRWVIMLRNYTDDAPSTLLPQFDLLNLLAELKDINLQLGIRIDAEPTTHGEVTSRCSMVCRAKRLAGADALHDLASVALLPGYSLTHTDTPLTNRPREYMELLPDFGQAFGPPIKPDWSPIFDLIRRRAEPLSVEITCQYSPEAANERRAGALLMGNDKGTELLASLPAATSTLGSIRLAVTCWGKATRDEPLMRAFGRRITGASCTPTSRTGAASPQGYLCSPAEAVRMWHAPYGDIQGRGLGHASTRLQLESPKMPKSGSSLGRASKIGPRYDQEVDVVSGWEDRMRHVYVVGKTGSGKTNLLKRLARQDIAAGKGCLVVSPHEDLIDYLVDTAGKRADDIVLLDFGDFRYTPVVNPLVMDVETASDYVGAIDQVTDVITDMTYHEFAGPVFRDNVRTALQTIGLDEIRQGMDPTIAAGIEIIRDKQLRDWAERVARSSRRDVANEWSNVTNLKASDVAEFVRWITAKFSDFSEGGALRLATSSIDGSRLSIRDIYRRGKVLLVHLPDTRIGPRAAEFLGRLIFQRVYQEARTASPQKRRDFLVHVDEFQRFVGTNLEVLVTEARKYRIGLTFAHQNLRQLQQFSLHEGVTSSRLGEAIFSNVGTLITMRASGSDVVDLARELQVSERYVRDIAQYDALARCTLAGEEQRSVTLRIPLEAAAPNREARSKLRRRMVEEGYWLPKGRVNSAVNASVARMAELADPLRAIPNRGRSISGAKRPTVGVAEQTQTDAPSGRSFMDEWLAKQRSRNPQQGTQAPRPDTTQPMSQQRPEPRPDDSSTDDPKVEE